MPGVIDQFCNQTALWEKRIPASQDIYGEPQYEPGIEIRVRFVRKHKTHRTEPGDVVVTTRSVVTIDTVQAGDRLTCEGETFEIKIGPNEAVWLDGEWWGAWCYG